MPSFFPLTVRFVPPEPSTATCQMSHPSWSSTERPSRAQPTGLVGGLGKLWSSSVSTKVVSVTFSVTLVALPAAMS